MKKHLFLKSLLVAIGLLMTSLTTQVWAWSFGGTHYFYFANTGEWSDGSIQMVIGSDSWTQYFTSNASQTAGLSNTLLYCCQQGPTSGWTDATFIGFMGNSGSWGEKTENKGKSNITTYANHYALHTSSVTAANNQLYVITPDASNKEKSEGATCQLIGTSYSSFNKTMTIKAKIFNGTTYVEGASKGAISANSYTFTSNTSCKNATSGSVSNGSTSGTISVGYTALTTLSVSSVSDGYAFMGWYDNSGNQLSTDPNFNTYHPASTSNFTVYAYFAPSFTSGSKLYLNTVDDSKWRDDNAVYRAFFFNGGNSTWAVCTQIGSSRIYEVTVPEGKWGAMIFARKNKSNNVENTWTETWDQTSDMYVSGVHNCVEITGSNSYNQRWADYAPVPAISGTMNDWSPTATPLTGTTLKRCTLTLAANTTYKFKVAYGVGESWYGRNSSFIGQTAYHTMATSENDCHLLTAGAGSYIFEWDDTNHRLTVSYPEETHPSSNYVYFKNSGNWDHVYVHMYNASEEADTYPGPAAETINFDGKSYYYAAIGDMTTAIFGDNNDSRKTGDISDIADNKGKYLNHNLSPYWFDFTQDVLLDPDNGNSTQTIVATYGAAMPSKLKDGKTAVTAPSFSGYTFGGYFKNSAGSGTQYYSNVCASAHVWDQTGASPSIYAKWTQNIGLDREGATSGSSSLAATYNAVLSTAGLMPPEKTGYDFAGYWTGDDGTGSMVINASGVVQTVADWTDGDKKWIHDGASTLHAKWTPVPLTFKADAATNAWATESNWNPACVPTIEHDVTIKKAVTVSTADAKAKSVAFDGGSLTIASTGALEVAGTITNDDVSKIVINSTTTNQGALIFNSTGSTAATVNMTMNPDAGKFQFVAIPVSYVDVSAAFEGKGVYTYVWKNSVHDWEQRGYYDGISSFEAVLVKGKAGTSFSGNLVNTSNFSSGSLSYSSSGYGDVYMFGNSWTAPIKKSAMTLSGISSVNILLKNNSWDGLISDDIIPALQAYAVIVGSTGGSVSINYTDAVRGVASGSRTSPLKAPQRFADVEPEPITLYVSGNEMRTRIRLFEDEARFSEELDEGWEAYYMEGEGYAGDLYAMGPERKMNVLATSNLEGTVVGFVPGQAENYTISFAGDGKGYYLNDVKEEEATLIEEGNTYEFTSDEKTNATRFVISKTPVKKTPTSVENISNDVKARKQMIDGTLYIIRDGRIYNAEGSLVK